MLKSIFITIACLIIFGIYLSVYSLFSNGAGDTLNINTATDAGRRFSNLFGFNLSARCDFAHIDAAPQRSRNFIIFTPAKSAAQKLQSSDFSPLNACAKDILSFKKDVDLRKGSHRQE